MTRAVLIRMHFISALFCVLAIGCDSADPIQYEDLGVDEVSNPADSTKNDDPIEGSQTSGVQLEGEYELAFISVAANYWEAVPSPDWSNTTSTDQHTSIRQRFLNGTLVISDSTRFELTSNIRYQTFNDNDDISGPTSDYSEVVTDLGTYTRFDNLILFQAESGWQFFGEVMDYKVRLYFPSRSFLGIQADFKAASRLFRTDEPGSETLVGQLETIWGLQIPQQVKCNSISNAWISGGSLVISPNGWYEMLLEYRRGYNWCDYDPNGEILTSYHTQEALVSGSVIKFGNPHDPEWPFFGVIKNSVLSVYRVPVLDGNGTDFSFRLND